MTTMNDATHDVLIVPGWGDSGPEHWQTLWQRKNPSYIRVVHKEWINVTLSEWVSTLDQYVCACTKPVVLVAHSLSCILCAHWAQLGGDSIAAAFLVAPTDVERRETCPPETWCFAPIPRTRLPFKSMIVASGDDPYTDVAKAELLAKQWGSEFINVGDAGHVNVASGHGPWPEGEALLKRLMQLAG
jgi:predicted alpha/beta hydrolase family esterase